MALTLVTCQSYFPQVLWWNWCERGCVCVFVGRGSCLRGVSVKHFVL